MKIIVLIKITATVQRQKILSSWFRIVRVFPMLQRHGFSKTAMTGDLDSIYDGWTKGDHTAVDTIIYNQVPGREKLYAALDNTDLYYIM
jgi:hypothetical protein